MYQSGKVGDKAKKRKSPAKSRIVGITVNVTFDSTMASLAEFDTSGTVSEFASSVADVGTSNHEIFRGLSEIPCSFSNATFCNRFFHIIVCPRLKRIHLHIIAIMLS